jgi:hypothetical protein
MRVFAYALKQIMSCYAEVCDTVTQTQTRSKICEDGWEVWPVRETDSEEREGEMQPP